MADLPLSGSVALVTGAGTGIGAAAARRLAREGAAVALVARSRDRLEEVVRSITALGGHALPMPADIVDPRPAEQVVQDTLDRFGRLDILVNTPGTVLLGTALHATVEQWDRMVARNISAVLHVIHAAVPYLIDAAATSGRQLADIVNVSSTAGRVFAPGGSVYSLTQCGLASFSKALRQELVPERVRVGLIQHGTTDDDDVADTIAYMVTRDHRTAVNELVARRFDE